MADEPLYNLHTTHTKEVCYTRQTADFAVRRVACDSVYLSSRVPTKPVGARRSPLRRLLNYPLPKIFGRAPFAMTVCWANCYLSPKRKGQPLQADLGGTMHVTWSVCRRPYGKFPVDFHLSRPRGAALAGCPGKQSDAQSARWPWFLPM